MLWRRGSGAWILLHPARLPQAPGGMRAGGHVSVCARGVGRAEGAAKGPGVQVEGW